MEELEDTVMSFRHFLENASREQQQESFSPGEDDYLMCRGESTTLITEDDFEAEVLDWALQYLLRIQCPSALASAISRNVLLEMKTLNLDSILHIASAPADPIVKAYDPVKLWAIVVSKVQDICQQWQEVTDQELSSLVSKKENVSVCAIKNGRRKMEDRHVVIQDLNILFGLQGHPPTSFYAVFDGHAGTDAACYSAIHLHYNIVHHPSYPHDIEKAMKDGFKSTDKNFISKSDREGLKSGSTALCCLVRDKQLYLAWLGDSQAILVRGGTPVNIMSPHKPDRADERDRIENLGGVVLHFGTWRVNGTLAVSRAIGDAEYKPYVSSDPDVAVPTLDGTEDFVVLACDGLWDVLQAHDVAELVYSHLAQHPDDLSGVSGKLVQVAKERGSSDNITVITVFLRAVEDMRAHAMLEKLAVTKSVAGEDDFLFKSGKEGPLAAVTTTMFESPVNGNPFSDSGYSRLSPENLDGEPIVTSTTGRETLQPRLDPSSGDVNSTSFAPDFMSGWDTAGFQQRQQKMDPEYPVASDRVGDYERELSSAPLDYAAYENPFEHPGSNSAYSRVESSDPSASFGNPFVYQQDMNYDLTEAAAGDFMGFRSQEVEVSTERVFSAGGDAVDPSRAWSDGLGGLELETNPLMAAHSHLYEGVKPFESNLSPDAEPFVMGSKFVAPVPTEELATLVPLEAAVDRTPSPAVVEEPKQEKAEPEMAAVAGQLDAVRQEPVLEVSVAQNQEAGDRRTVTEEVHFEPLESLSPQDTAVLITNDFQTEVVGGVEPDRPNEEPPSRDTTTLIAEDYQTEVVSGIKFDWPSDEPPLVSDYQKVVKDVSTSLLMDTEPPVVTDDHKESVQDATAPLLMDTEPAVAVDNQQMVLDESAQLLLETEPPLVADDHKVVHDVIESLLMDHEPPIVADDREVIRDTNVLQSPVNEPPMGSAFGESDFGTTLATNEVPREKAVLAATPVDEVSQNEVSLDDLVAPVAQKVVAETRLSTSEETATIPKDLLNKSETVISDLQFGYSEDSTFHPSALHSEALIQVVSSPSRIETVPAEVSAASPLMLDVSKEVQEVASVEPVSMDRIPDSASIADDVEDDESEDGEGWKFYRTEATGASVSQEPLVVPSTDDATLAKPADLPLEPEDKETAGSKTTGADVTNQSSSSLLEGEFQPLEVSPEVLAPPAASAVMPTSEPVPELAKVAEPAQPPTVKDKEKPKVAPTKEPVKSKAPSKPGATAKATGTTKAGPSKPSASLKPAPSKPSATTKRSIEVPKAPTSKSAATARTSASATTRMAKATDAASKKEPDAVKKPSTATLPTAAKATSAAAKVSASRTTATISATRKTTVSATAKVSKEQINVRSKPTTVSDDKENPKASSGAAAAGTKKLASTAASVTARLATSKTTASTMHTKKEVTKTQVGPKVSSVTSTATKMTVKQTKETVNKQISSTVHKATATTKSKVDSVTKTATSLKSPASTNGHEQSEKESSHKLLTSTPKKPTTATKTATNARLSPLSSNVSSSKSPPKSTSKVSPVSRTNVKTQKKSPAAAAVASTTPTPTKKSTLKKEVDEVSNEKGILDASSKEVVSHPDGLKNGDVHPDDHVGGVAENGVGEVPEICPQNSAALDQPEGQQLV